MLDLKDINNITNDYHALLSAQEREEFEQQLRIGPAFKEESIAFFHLFDGF